MKYENLLKENPTLKKISEAKEIAWVNERYLPFDMTNAVCQLIVSDEDIDSAAKRLERFAAFLKKEFPETQSTNGLIESDIIEIPNMKSALEKEYNCSITGKLFMKKDSHLAIAGSIKARGGIYEVLKHAEDLALKESMILENDSYEKFADSKMKDFLSQYTVQVGSTGNLGLSIGIMSAAIGFKVKVHMSADAKQWKKDLLRSRGAEVIEYTEDYSKAVAEGRRLSDLDEKSYFVDDEKSVNLFLGYAVAAKRLKAQLDEMNISVDKDHPLIVYLPTGVGGAPGGVSYGLKRIFKDNVHCFFVEPVQCPSVLLGIETQLFENANVKDFGLTGKTEADGLACANPSSFVTRIMTNLLSGDFTVEDRKLFDYLRLLYSTENEQIEPSSCAAFIGPVNLLKEDSTLEYCKKQNLNEDRLKNATHIVWATGGKMVPEDIRKQYLDTYL